MDGKYSDKCSFVVNFEPKAMITHGIEDFQMAVANMKANDCLIIFGVTNDTVTVNTILLVL